MNRWAKRVYPSQAQQVTWKRLSEGRSVSPVEVVDAVRCAAQNGFSVHQDDVARASKIAEKNWYRVQENRGKVKLNDLILVHSAFMTLSTNLPSLSMGVLKRKAHLLKDCPAASLVALLNAISHHTAAHPKPEHLAALYTVVSTALSEAPFDDVFRTFSSAVECLQFCVEAALSANLQVSRVLLRKLHAFIQDKIANCTHFLDGDRFYLEAAVVYARDCRHVSGFANVVANEGGEVVKEIPVSKKALASYVAHLTERISGSVCADFARLPAHHRAARLPLLLQYAEAFSVPFVHLLDMMPTTLTTFLTEQPSFRAYAATAKGCGRVDDLSKALGWDAGGGYRHIDAVGLAEALLRMVRLGLAGREWGVVQTVSTHLTHLHSAGGDAHDLTECTLPHYPHGSTFAVSFRKGLATILSSPMAREPLCALHLLGLSVYLGEAHRGEMIGLLKASVGGVGVGIGRGLSFSLLKAMVRLQVRNEAVLRSHVVPHLRGFVPDPHEIASSVEVLSCALKLNIPPPTIAPLFRHLKAPSVTSGMLPSLLSKLLQVFTEHDAVLSGL